MTSAAFSSRYIIDPICPFYLKRYMSKLLNKRKIATSI